MKTVSILIRNLPIYRHSCFVAGFKKHGFVVTDRALVNPGERDVIVTWNRYNMHEHLIRNYERAGATVLISENGYVGNTKALAKNHHNGAGSWYVGAEDKWSKLGIELQPWRKDGDFILVLPQRGMGEQGVAMPRNWTANMLKKLSNYTRRPIRVRKHPGQDKCTPLEDDLKGAWAAVTWGSGAGIKSIIAGVPVFNEFDKWIGKQSASGNLSDIENPYVGERLPMLEKLAWAQWPLADIESGEALECYI